MAALIIFALLLSSATEYVNGCFGSTILTIQYRVYEYVVSGQYDDAVSIITGSQAPGLGSPDPSGWMNETVQDLFISNFSGNAMSFGYKLWKSGAENLVQQSFPAPCTNILSGENVKIVNIGYNQAMKLDANTDADGDRLAFGDSSDMTSNRVSWKFMPEWGNNEVVYKIYNNNYNQYLKLAVAVDSIGDRRAYGSDDADTDRHKFYLEPINENGTISFFIINYQYDQGLKLAVAIDSIGDRAVFSHHEDVHVNTQERFKWEISQL